MMAELLCPECGKANPPGNETCQFCSAKLDKLNPGIENTNPEKSQEDGKTGKLNQWLDELRSDIVSESNKMDDEQPKSGAFSWMSDWIYEDTETGTGRKFSGDRIAKPVDFERANEEIDPGERSELNVHHRSVLPTWLASMKPTGTSSSRENKTGKDLVTSEDTVPLDGIETIFPSIQLPSSKSQLSKISPELDISQAQQAQISLLRQIIKSEEKRLPVSTRTHISSSGLLSLLVAFLLALSILVALVYPKLSVDAPSLANFPAAWDAYRYIDKMSPGQVVLMVFDYEPGASGEMDMLTEVVLRHLIRRKAALVLVSTNPIGPLQAEKMIRQVSQDADEEFIPFRDFVNLGFIPGGHAGLLGFFNEPRTSLPFTIDGVETWKLPGFQMIQDISDFSLVIVATENSDTARMWIEQLQPIQSIPPLVMAISAQVEAVIAPYYMASPQQVSGYVHGLAGAAAYESVTVYSDQSVQSYSPFSLAGLMAVFIILLGSFVNIVASLVGKGSKVGRVQGAGQ